MGRRFFAIAAFLRLPTRVYAGLRNDDNTWALETVFLSTNPSQAMHPPQMPTCSRKRAIKIEQNALTVSCVLLKESRDLCPGIFLRTVGSGHRLSVIKLVMKAGALGCWSRFQGLAV